MPLQWPMSGVAQATTRPRGHAGRDARRSAAAALLWVAGLAIGGCAGETAESSMRAARAHLEKNEEKAAIIELKNALQKNPDLGEARFLLGKALLDSGDAQLAAVELAKASQLGHSPDSVAPALAAAFNAQGLFRDTLAKLGTTALEKPVARSALQVELAHAHAQQGNRAGSEAAIAAALKATPDYAPALVLKARYLARDGHAEDALKMADSVLARAPESADAWNLKGDVLYNARHDLAGSIDAYRQAVKRQPRFVGASSSLLAVLIESRDLTAAEAELARLKRVRPGAFEVRYYEALLAFERKNFDVARRLAEELVVLAPRDAKVLHLAAAVKLQAGVYGQAESFASKALQSSPGNASSLRLLGQIYLRSGQPAKALELLLPIVERGAERGDITALVAHAFLLNGDAQRAESYFAQAARLAPDDTTSRIALALTRLSTGKADEALAELRSIASRDAGTTADLALISALSRRRQFDAAMTAIDGLERKEPKSSQVPLLKGRIALARGDRNGARAGFEQALALSPAYFPAAGALASLDMLENKPDAARQRLERLLADDPRNLQALLALAELRLRAGAPAAEVDGLLARAVESNPTASAPRMLLIERALKANDAKRATTLAEQGLAALPDDARLLDALGRSRVASGDFNQALVSFNRLVELDPKAVQPQLRLAETFAAMKRRDAALQSVRKALAMAPDSLAAQRALFSLHLAANQLKEARDFARTLQSRKPRESTGHLFEGEVDMAAGEWNAAATSFRVGLEKRKSPGLAVKLHTALLKGGKRSDADRLAATWMTEFPRDTVFLYHLADSALAGKDYVAAERHYRAFIEAQPQSPVALNNLAWLTWKLGKPGALALAERANKLAPDQPALLDTWAMLLAEGNRMKEAIDLQSQAVRLQPQQPGLHLNLAKMLIKAGDKARARDELEAVVKLGTTFSDHGEASALLKTL